MNQEKEHGFTLVELLAVLVILALIALIMTPMVMKAIEGAKKDSAARSLENYVKAIEVSMASSRINGVKIKDGIYSVDGNGNLTGNALKEPLIIQTNGNKPKSGTVKIENGGVSMDGTRVMFGDYSVNFNAEMNDYEAIKLETFNLITSLTNIEGLSDNVKEMTTIETKTLTFKAINGYKLPKDVTVIGANKTWDRGTGTLTLSRVTKDVTIKIDGAVKTMCNAVSNATKTTGNVPEDKYANGDEYICDLGDTEDSRNLTFFIVAATDSEVSLIMNQNLGANVSWCSDTTKCKTNNSWDNTKGPLTAQPALEERTKNWTKIIDKTKITLPSREMIIKAYSGTMPLWLYDYLRNTTHNVTGVYGYWMSDKPASSTTGVYALFWQGEYTILTINNSLYGIRPVITIPKSNLS